MIGAAAGAMEQYTPVYGCSTGGYAAAGAASGSSAAQPQQWQMQQQQQQRPQQQERTFHGPGAASAAGAQLPGQVVDGSSAGSTGGGMYYVMVPMPYAGGMSYGGGHDYGRMPSGQFNQPYTSQEQYRGYWGPEDTGYTCAIAGDPNYSRWTSETSYSSEQHWGSGAGGGAHSAQWKSEDKALAAKEQSAEVPAAAVATEQPADVSAAALANVGGRRGPGSSLQRRRRRQRATRQPSQHQDRRGDHPRPRHVESSDAEVSADLTARLNAGGDELTSAVDALLEPSMVRRLSFEPAGCRVVQLALEKVDRQIAADLAIGLRGHVVEAIRSPHANYVLQKIVKVLTAKEAAFLVEEVAKASPDLARHEYGCRIYCRLLEHMASDPAVSKLIDDVLWETEELLRHTFGHHVVECALEHGLPQQRQQIIAALRKNLLRSAWNRNAAYVVEKALLYGNVDDQTALATDLLSCSSADLAQLARSQFGSMVVRALLRLPSPIPERVHKHLSGVAAQAQLKTTKHGRRLLEDHSLGLALGTDRLKDDVEMDRFRPDAHEHLCL